MLGAVRRDEVCIMGKESDWMLEALVSIAAGHPVGMSNRSEDDDQAATGRKIDDGVVHSNEPNHLSLVQRLRSFFENLSRRSNR